MILESKYDIGQIVYLKTDKEQEERMVTGISWRTAISYELSLGALASWHQEFEISEEKDVLISDDN